MEGTLGFGASNSLNKATKQGTIDEGDVVDDAPAAAATSLPENCVEYMILLIDNQLDVRQARSRLEAIKKAATQLAADLTKDYIWQRDGFVLEVKSRSGE
jgi:hypothetical protein